MKLMILCECLFTDYYTKDIRNIKKMMLFVYLMDRFVWMLLLTVFTTLALDLTGVMATHALSDSSTMMEENLHFNIEADSIFHDYAIREKRQSSESPTDGRSPVLDSIFNPSTKSSKVRYQSYRPSGKTDWLRRKGALQYLDSVSRGERIVVESKFRFQNPSLTYTFNKRRLRRDRISIAASH